METFNINHSEETEMSNNERRNFLKIGGAGLAGILAVGVAPAAIAGTDGVIKGRIASSFPKTLPTIYGAAEVFANVLRAISKGKIDFTVHAAGEIVPGLKVLDATIDGTVEMCHTATYYYKDKDKVFPQFSGIPYGLNARAMNGWMHQGGGNELANEVFAKHGLAHLPLGNTGAQMGGWFKKKINSKEDLKGLKMRVGSGIAADILGSLGVQTKILAGGDIVAAMEKNELDAGEFVGPFDDEKLGLHKHAKFYNYPAFWEGGTQLSLIPNGKWYNSLPAEVKEMMKVAAAYATAYMLAQYDTLNPQALKSLVSKGVELVRMPKDVMDQAFYIAEQLYADYAKADPMWAKVHTSMTKYRDAWYQWQRIAENTYDGFMMNQRGNRI